MIFPSEELWGKHNFFTSFSNLLKDLELICVMNNYFKINIALKEIFLIVSKARNLRSQVTEGNLVWETFPKSG